MDWSSTGIVNFFHQGGGGYPSTRTESLGAPVSMMSRRRRSSDSGTRGKKTLDAESLVIVVADDLHPDA